MWGEAKKLKYEKNIFRTFCDPKYTDYVGVFTLMVKTGEIYNVNWSKAWVDDRGYL